MRCRWMILRGYISPRCCGVDRIIWKARCQIMGVVFGHARREGADQDAVSVARREVGFTAKRKTAPGIALRRVVVDGFDGDVKPASEIDQLFAALLSSPDGDAADAQLIGPRAEQILRMVKTEE